MLNFRDVRPGDVEHIVRNLCAGERMTLATMNLDPGETVRDSVESADVVRIVADENDTPLAVFGVHEPVLWFIATDNAFEHRRAMLVEGRKFVAEMLQRFPYLVDAVDSRHKGVRTWLRLLGFTESRTIPYKDVEFHVFERRA